VHLAPSRSAAPGPNGGHRLAGAGRRIGVVAGAGGRGWTLGDNPARRREATSLTKTPQRRSRCGGQRAWRRAGAHHRAGHRPSGWLDRVRPLDGPGLVRTGSGLTTPAAQPDRLHAPRLARWHRQPRTALRRLSREITPLFGQALAQQVAQASEATCTREVWSLVPAPARWPSSCSTRWLRPGQPVERLHHRGPVGQPEGAAAPDLGRPRAKVRSGERRSVPIARRGGGQASAERNTGEIFARQAACGWSAVWPLRTHQPLRRRRRACPGRRRHAPRPPLDVKATDHRTEIHPQAEASVRTLAERLQRGGGIFAGLWLSGGRVLPPAAPHGHGDVPPRAPGPTANPLAAVGLKDITAHVNFTGIALAAQAAGPGGAGVTPAQAPLFDELRAWPIAHAKLPRCQHARPGAASC